MKIIAGTNDGYIMEVSTDEVAKLLGFRGSYDSDFKRSMPEIDDNINIDDTATISNYVRNLDTNQLQVIKHDLQSAIKNIDGAVKKVQSMNLFETIKEV